MEIETTVKDMCVHCDDGILNIRVGAIIMKNNKILMVSNERADYLYSVGGRIKFGETAEEAGLRMAVGRLGFIHENYFCGDSPATAKPNTGRKAFRHRRMMISSTL